VLDVAPLPAAAWHQPLAPIRGDKATKQRFATYAVGYFHIDLTEVSTEQGKLCLFPAIDRTSKFAFVRLVESAGKMEAPDVLRDLIEGVPIAYTLLTDNGVQFTARKQDIWDRQHIFDRVCDEHDIKHKLTEVNHPLNQRTGRADEPHHPGSDRQTLPIRQQ
jgi:hypothetical protein